MEIQIMPLSVLITPDWHPRKRLQFGDDEYERLKVLLDLGFEAAEVSIIDLPIEKESALRIALNNHAGEWDMPLLKDMIIELEACDIDIELTGFSRAEIEKLLGRGVVEDDFDAEKEAEKIEAPISRRGDIYQLGRHRLMCGDSTVAADMDRLMDGNRADMVFTDPPYNVNYGATMKDKMRTKVSKENAGRKILNDHFKTNEGFYVFLRDAIAAFRPYVKGDVYVCMSSSELHTLQRAFGDCGGHFSTFIIWVKNHFTIGRANYQRQYEPILYGWFEGSSHYWSGVRNLGDVYGRNQVTMDGDGVPLVRVEACGIESDIWDFAKPVKSKEHPTMKPIALCARAIRNSSQPGEKVLDAFSGSGSTLIASEQTDRACYAMELSEVYCDVDVKRWEQFTGKRAELIHRD